MMTLSREVAHDLELEFFPAEDRFLDKDFVDGREIEAAGQQLDQLFAIVGDAAAGAAQGEARAQDHREANLAGELEAVAKVVDQRGFGDVETDAGHGVLEHQAVFGLLDGGELRADELHVVLFEHLRVGEFDREVERGLAADRGQQGEAASGGTGVPGTRRFCA